MWRFRRHAVRLADGAAITAIFTSAAARSTSATATTVAARTALAPALFATRTTVATLARTATTTATDVLFLRSSSRNGGCID